MKRFWKNKNKHYSLNIQNEIDKNLTIFPEKVLQSIKKCDKINISWGKRISFAEVWKNKSEAKGLPDALDKALI